jgi:hypothetical protein
MVGGKDLNRRSPGPTLGALSIFPFCKLLILRVWSGRLDLNQRPPGPEPGALARLRYAPTMCSQANRLAAGILRISQPSGPGHSCYFSCFIVPLPLQNANYCKNETPPS